MSHEDSRYAEQIREVTRLRIDLIRSAANIWRFAESLKSITEDTAQEYQGRAVLELIQNGHDAIEDGSTGRIHVLLDLAAPHPALYVANDGGPFESKNFQGIIDLGLSSKGAGEGIGNKGLGFRSVLLLTDRPEVYSRDPDDPADRNLSGYSFRFPTVTELAGLTDDRELGERLAAEVSPLNLPVPASADDPRVLKFASDGFATVIKLPLRDDVATAEAKRQLDESAKGEAPILLFLERISILKLTVLLADQSADATRLARSERPTSLLAEPSDWISDVDLGSQGRYVLARRRVDSELFTRSIRESVDARLADARWLEWDGAASVAVAVPLGGPPGPGLIYTFLPMKESSPLAAHVHAPFFTKLARRDVSLDVPLNDYLMSEIAATCLSLLRELRDGADHGAAASLVVDLATWTPPRHEFLSRACRQAESALDTERFVPVAGTADWSSLRDAFVLPARAAEPSVITSEVVAAVGYPILDPRIGPDRQKRVVELHKAVVGTGMEPASDTLADWIESLAAKLQSDPAEMGTWARFYDELSELFPSRVGASSLRGKAIILDQDSRLQPALGRERAVRGSRQVFFAPSPDDEEGDVSVRLPRALATRITYTNPGISWTTGAPARHTPGRAFLDTHGLVREYNTDQMLAVLRDLLAQSASESVRLGALEFACSIYPTLRERQQEILASVPFAVPAVGGGWRPAAETVFSRVWGTDGGKLLDRLLAFATEATPSLLALESRFLAPPAEWPTPIRDQARWVTFLRAIGVQDGLPLERFLVVSQQGGSLWASYIANRMGLAQAVAEAWNRDVAEHWNGGRHPYTAYRFSAPIAVLPGASEVEALGSEARKVYARLLGLGMATWPANAFEVTVLRPERTTDYAKDRHRWPTPVSSYLRHGNWLPVESPGNEDDRLEFTRPSNAWLPGQSSLPAFVPQILQSVRNLIAEEPAHSRLRKVGTRIWDDPEDCGQVLRQLSVLLKEGRIPPHDLVTFKKQCRLAWDRLAASPERWPWQDNEAPVVVVTERGRIGVLKLEAGSQIVVPDETDESKVALLGLTALPMLVVDAERGRAVAEAMEARQLSVVQTAALSIQVFGDDQRITANPDLPTLVTEERQWLETIVALVAELKAGSFARHTEQSIHQMLDRLRQIRLARAQFVRLLVGDEEISPPEHTASLPIDDVTAPVVVFWGSGNTSFEEMEQCAESLATLIGQPHLAAPLQLACSRLGRSYAGPPSELADRDLASALQVNEAQIRESRASLRGALFDVLDRIRILLAYFAGAASITNFDAKLPDSPTEGDITAALETWAALLTMPPSDLVTRCLERPSLADLRDDLYLDFRRFNDALQAVTPPHPPLHHPERHEQAVARFAEDHSSAILDRLREAYLPVARDHGDLTAYGHARNLGGLESDPAWLDVCAEPADDVVAAQVSRWLTEHGANTDLVRPTDLPDVGELRSRNTAALDRIVQEADLRIRARTLKRGSEPPGAWNAPVTAARSAFEQSYRADFWVLTEDELLQFIAQALDWPDDMPVTLDLDLLGLDTADLLSKEEATAEDRRRRQHERTHLSVDAQEVSVATVDDLSKLSDTIASGLAEDFLGQSGKVTLGQPPSVRRSFFETQGGSGLTVARMSRMSNEQTTAVGLIGEIAAQAWLERHYVSVEWVSGYRNIVLGDTRGSDSNGYDFTARNSEGDKGRTIYFEVKAMDADAFDIAEFELGETEVRAAQRHGNAYRVLLVCSVRDSTARRILELPNPLSSQGSRRYTLMGRGLRYRCTIGAR